MQEKKNTPKNIESKREREREREIYLFVRENYAQNEKENENFIIRWLNMKRQNKGRWRKRWIMILRLRIVGRWKGKGGKEEETK